MKSLLLSLLTVFTVVASAEDDGATAPPLTNEQFGRVFERLAEECKDHFDLRPYLDIVLEKEESPLVTPEVIASLRSFSETGRIELPADKINDLVAQKCVTIAEGMVTGSVGNALLNGIVEALAKVTLELSKVFADSFGKIITGLHEALTHPVPPAK